MQRTRINAVNETIRQLLDNINEISEKMKSQSDAINRTSVSVQQMMSNIVTVSQGSTRANTYSKFLMRKRETEEIYPNRLQILFKELKIIQNK